MDGVLDGIPSQFSSFSIGESTRTPLEVLSHVADVLSWSNEQVLAGSFTYHIDGDDWSGQTRRYRAALFSLDRALLQVSISEDQALRMIQGPISDVLTHVGQLAMLRRLAGAPVPARTFYTLSLPSIAQSVV